MFNISNKKLAKDFFAYISILIIQKSFPFFILPILSRLFTADEFGFYLLYQSFFLLLIPIFTLSVDNPLCVNYYHYKPRKYAIVFFNTLIFVCLYFISLLIIFFLLYDWIGSKLKFPSFWLLMTILNIIPFFVYNIRISLYRYQGKLKKFGLYSIASTSLSFLVSFTLIYFTDLSWESFIIGNLLSYGVLSIFAFTSFIKEGFISIRLNLSYIYESIKVGFPLCLHVVGSWFSNSLNRILLNVLIGTGATASYGIGATFGMIMTLIQDSINLAYSPYIYKELSNNIDLYKIAKTGLYIYFTIIIMSVLISFIGYISVGLIFGNEYESTKKYIIPLVLASAFNGFYKIHSTTILYHKKTTIIATISLSAGCINILLSYFMIKWAGILGAAYSALFVQILIYILTAKASNNLVSIKYIEVLKQKLKING